MVSEFGPSFLTFSDQIALHGRFRSADPALIGEQQTLTWQELDSSGNRYGHALIKAGIHLGDCICCLLPNTLRAYELILGIWRAGAVVVPLSPLMTPETLGNMIADCGAPLLISDGDYAELAAETCARAGIGHIDFHTGLDQFLADTPDSNPGVIVPPDNLCNIIYSSGTTGTPKGIPHTHRGRTAISACLVGDLGFSRHSKAISVIPPHSNGGWLSWLPAFVVGCPTVILSAFEPRSYLETVKRERPTHGFLVPTICGALLEQPDIEDMGLESFQGALTAGAPMPAAMKQRMMELTDNGLWELWGLTESVATMISPQEMLSRPESVGRPMIGSDLRIIDDQGNDITGAGVGEIVGRSSSMMPGYLNRPEANQESQWFAEDGSLYFRTGDVGEIDDGGYLTLRGRIKDMIISGGLNVFPVDIESILLQHDAIADAAVIGIEHPKWGESPIAYVIVQPGADCDLDAVKEWANGQLAKHQRLADVVAADEFPRNTLGKVLKQELVNRYTESQ